MREQTYKEVRSPIASLSIEDPEILADAIRNARLQPCRISHRPAPSIITRIAFPSVCLDFAQLGSAMLFTGSMPDDSYTIIFVLDCPEPGHSFNFSTTHTDGYIGFFPPGGLIDAMTPSGYANATLTMPTEEFHVAVSRHFPEMPDSVLLQGAAMRVPEKEQRILRSLISEFKVNMQHKPCVFADAVVLRKTESQLIAAFLEALRGGCAHLVPRSSQNSLSRGNQFREARDFINAQLFQPIRSSDICRAMKISERGLDYLFHDHIGLSPHLYIRHQRLHRARRLLQKTEVRPGLVKKVALDLGFRHLGRFAAYYSDFFGENPGETASRPVRAQQQQNLP